jgi:hypothetical protein
MTICIVCHERKAEIPDRERMGRPIKRVCRECHSARLRGDLAKVLKDRERRAFIREMKEEK